MEELCSWACPYCGFARLREGLSTGGNVSVVQHGACLVQPDCDVTMLEQHELDVPAAFGGDASPFSDREWAAQGVDESACSMVTINCEEEPDVLFDADSGMQLLSGADQYRSAWLREVSIQLLSYVPE